MSPVAHDEHKRRLAVAQVALDYGNVFQAVALLAEGYEAEMAVACGHIHFHALFHELLGGKAIRDEVADGYQFHAPFVGMAAQCGQSHHASVVGHDFHKGGSRGEACQAGEIHGGLGVACAFEYALRLRVQRIDVAGTPECSRG